MVQQAYLCLLHQVTIKSCEGPDQCSKGQLIGILSKQGNLIKSWPAPKRLQFGIVLGDISGDGKLEIAASSAEYYSGTIYLWNSDGDYVSGWPKTLTGNSYLPALADVNGDGRVDVISSFHRDFSRSTYTYGDFYSINAWNSDGSEIAGWPMKVFLTRLLSAPSNLQATILDLNKDGKLDLALLADEGKVYLLSPGGKYEQSKVEWGMYRYDNRRSGVYPLPSIPTPQPTPSSSPSASPFSQTISISAGNNLIGISVDKGSGYKVSNLAEDLNRTQKDTVTSISRWYNGAWQTHIVNFPANNFDIKPGEGYLVKGKQPAQINISGNLATSTSLTIGPGWNSISFPTVSSSISSAKKLLEQLNKQGIEIHSLARWKDGKWDSYTNRVSANDFPIISGEGYYLRSNTNAYKTFTLPNPSAPISTKLSTQAATPPQTLLSCTPCTADINKDKNVSISDYSLWAYCRLRGINISPRCSNADLDKDGKVGNTSLKAQDDPELKCITSQMGKKC